MSSYSVKLFGGCLSDPPTSLPLFQCPDIVAEYALKKECKKQSINTSSEDSRSYWFQMPLISLLNTLSFFPRHTVTRGVLHGFHFHYIATSIYSTNVLTLSDGIFFDCFYSVHNLELTFQVANRIEQTTCGWIREIVKFFSEIIFHTPF